MQLRYPFASSKYLTQLFLFVKEEQIQSLSVAIANLLFLNYEQIEYGPEQKVQNECCPPKSINKLHAQQKFQMI